MAIFGMSKVCQVYVKRTGPTHEKFREDPCPEPVQVPFHVVWAFARGAQGRYALYQFGRDPVQGAGRSK